MIEFTGLEATFRPIERWPTKPTASRTTSRFRSTWAATLGHLKGEIAKLAPKRVLILMDLMEREIRNDGYPRADARPHSPGVILRFEMKDGSWLVFPCDTYVDWQDNVRAIALTMEKLRDIDRYGVTKSGEQYAGWKALPPAGGSTVTMTVEEAAGFISTELGVPWKGIYQNREIYALAYKNTAKLLHPDLGGDEAKWHQLQEAKQVLDAHHEQGGTR